MAVPLGGHDGVGVDGGTGHVHVGGFSFPDLPGEHHEPGDPLPGLALKGVVAGGEGQQLVVGADVHLGVEDGPLPDLGDEFHHLLVAVLVDEAVVEEVRVVLFADHHPEYLPVPLVKDAVVAYQGMGAVVFDGLVVQQFPEHLAIVHVVGVDDGVGAGLPLGHPVVHKGHAVLVIRLGEVPALVEIVIDILHHRHIQVLGAVDLDPPGDVLVLGVKGGELGQVGAGVAVHVLRPHVRVAVGGLLVLDEPLVLVGLGKDAGDIDDAADKHQQRKAQDAQADAVIFGQLLL